MDEIKKQHALRNQKLKINKASETAEERKAEDKDHLKSKKHIALIKSVSDVGIKFKNVTAICRST